MRNAILLTIIGVLLPVIVVKPHIGIYAWFWLGLMNPHRLTYGSAFDMPFAAMIAIVTIAAYLISREPKRYPINFVTVTLIVWHIWISITTLFALNSVGAIDDWIWVSKVFLMTYVTFPLINTRKRLDVLVWVIVLSVGFFGIKGGVWAIVTGGEYTLYGPTSSNLEDNNSLALGLSMVLPLFIYLYLQTKKTWIRFTLAFCTSMCFISIAVTYARGVYVGIAAMIAYQGLLSKYRIPTIVLGIISIVAVFMFMPSQFKDEVTSINDYRQDNSSLTRLMMWKYGWKLALDRPIIGGGFDVYPYEPVYPKYGLRICNWEEYAELHGECVIGGGRTSHSNYFQVLGEHGFVGLTIYAALGISSFFMGFSVIRQSKGRDDLKWAGDMARMLQLSMVAYGVGGLFYNMAFFDLYYAIISMMVITRILINERELPADNYGYAHRIAHSRAPRRPAQSTPAVRRQHWGLDP